MYRELFLFLIFTIIGIFCQNPMIEYVNGAGEDLLVRLVHEEKDLLLPIGEKYVYDVPSSLDSFLEEIWAIPAKCQNETCDYIRSTIGVSMNPLTTNVNETVSKYVIFPGPYNRGYIIESLDKPDCSVASCYFNLEENCPDFDQIRDEEGTVVACNINGPAVYSMICPFFAKTSIGFQWEWFTCQASQTLRVTIN